MAIFIDIIVRGAEYQIILGLKKTELEEAIERANGAIQKMDPDKELVLIDKKKTMLVDRSD